MTGYLVITVKGEAVEKFINMAVREGIDLWDIGMQEQKAVLKVGVDSFFDLRPLAKKTGCRLRIERKKGLPFFYSSFMRRRGLVLGLALFVAALYFLSSLVLFVSVEGAPTVGEDRVRELVSDLGARPGTLKSRLDTEHVASELLLREPRLSWVYLRFQGTVLVIEVVEKIQAPPEHTGPANLVAAKDGLVTEVLVVMGEPRVKPGDTVSRGQILIEGLIKPQDPLYAEPGQASEPVPVHAQGEVWARVWYEGYGEAALTGVLKTRTGRRTAVWTLVAGGREVISIGKTEVPYRNYELQTIKRDFSRRIIKLPVEVITVYAYELTLEEKTLTLEAALEKAALRARFLAELQLPVGISALNTMVDEIEPGDGLVGIRYTIETVENIAAEQAREAIVPGTVSQNGGR
jgi:similar to stage IV sporulation protein